MCAADPLASFLGGEEDPSWGKEQGGDENKKKKELKGVRVKGYSLEGS